MFDSEPQLHISRRHRFVAWIKRHSTLLIVIFGSVLVAGALLTVAYILTQKPLEPLVSIPPKPKPVYYSQLDGVQVAAESDLTKPVTAVIIENSPDARPQSGIKDAEVVYEAIAEGGITRFAVLYQQNSPSIVGPVRSLRPYFLDWAAPYQASIAHVGGSTKALKEVRNGNYRDIDQFFNSGSYWRATDRYMPHNVYTNGKKLAALNKTKGYKTSTFTSFPRTDGKASTEPNAKTVYINFSSAPFNTKYTYQAKCNCYNRYMGGVLHKDREKGTITPSVVIALHVDESTVMEDWWRERIITAGQGKAEIFQNGNVIQATWSKKNQVSPLQLLDSTGKPIELNRGQTWIAAVPNDGGSISWK